MASISIEMPDGIVTYTRAPRAVEAVLQRRFDNPTGVAAYHPNKSDHWLFDVRNWWDGASEIKDNDDGTFTYINPWTGESDTFS